MDQQTRVVLVAGDPFTTEPDQLEEEAEVIRESFKTGNRNAEVSVVYEQSEKELFRKLRNTSPQIVEFTGHGSPNRRIAMEDTRGRIRQKTSGSIVNLFKKSELSPDCLLFNNCFAGRNAKKLSQCAENFVQVQSDGVFDISLGFAKNFYLPLALEGSYRYALDNALDKMKAEGIPFGPETGLWQREALLEKDINFLVKDNYHRANGEIPVSVPKAVDESELSRKYTVWYATNRKPLDKIQSEFGSDYDEAIHYGKCEVAIPKYHKRGSVGNPFWKRWPVWNDDRLRIVSTSPRPVDLFWEELQSYMNALPIDEKYILLFIHGYAVTFKQAVIRAAQLGADLNVTGATALYSWPSKGRVKSYAADEATVEPSSEYLSHFLRDLASKSGAEQVHVIAHSMGNRAFLNALNKLLGEVEEATQLRFSQFFLAAPDIDARVFRQLSAAYSQYAKRTTMYVSAKDKALWGSKVLHEYPRAGYQPPITIVDHVDTIEVTDIDVGFLGHSYIAEAGDLLHDMYSLMLGNPHPSKRMGLKSQVETSTGLEFWRMQG